jgi:hypothetical protein
MRTDTFSGKEICMKGDSYTYSGNLYSTGNINKGIFNATSGTWTQQETLNDYFVMKGVKNSNGISELKTVMVYPLMQQLNYYNII